MLSRCGQPRRFVDRGGICALVLGGQPNGPTRPFQPAGGRPTSAGPAWLSPPTCWIASGGFGDSLTEDQELGARIVLAGERVEWLHDVQGPRREAGVNRGHRSATGPVDVGEASRTSGVPRRSCSGRGNPAALDQALRLVQPGRMFVAFVSGSSHRRCRCSPVPPGSSLAGVGGRYCNPGIGADPVSGAGRCSSTTVGPVSVAHRPGGAVVADPASLSESRRLVPHPPRRDTGCRLRLGRIN